MTPSRSRPGFIGQGAPDEIVQAGKSPPLLAFHGFGSTPRELDPLAEIARDLGLAIRAPLLPGHGTHPKDLQKTRFRDWYDGGEAALLRIRQDTKVILAGLSTGTLIALKLAATHRERVAGIVVLANALSLAAPFPSWPLRVLSRMHAPDFSMPKRKGPDIADPIARAAHLTYATQPFRAAADLQRAGSAVRQLLPRITCPTFIAHGMGDHVCPVSNAWSVANAIGTSDVEVLLLPRSWHIITKDFDHELLSQRLRAFIQRVVEGLPTPQMPVDP